MIFNIIEGNSGELDKYNIEMEGEEFESFVKTLISAYEGYDDDIIPSDYAQVLLQNIKEQLPETFNLMSNNLNVDSMEIE